MTRLLIRLFVKNSDDTENPAVRKSYGTFQRRRGNFLQLNFMHNKNRGRTSYREYFYYGGRT